MDFDGTLATLQSRPQRVRLAHDMRRVLRRLAQRPKVRMWVISGRLRADVQRRVNVAGVECLGLHGWDGSNGGLLNLKVLQSLRSAKREICGRLRGLPGVWIEDKAPAFAVHCRDASSTIALQAAAVVREVAGALASDLRLLRGLKVWEVLPRGFKGKGAAITALMAGLPPDALAIYLGDDATDEFGFAALPEGLTVRVGTRRATAARFYLRDPEEVTSFLQRMEEAIR
jgi:trehalose 6-phosphate phosphatase